MGRRSGEKIQGRKVGSGSGRCAILPESDADLDQAADGLVTKRDSLRLGLADADSVTSPESWAPGMEDAALRVSPCTYELEILKIALGNPTPGPGKWASGSVGSCGAGPRRRGLRWAGLGPSFPKHFRACTSDYSAPSSLRVCVRGNVVGVLCVRLFPPCFKFNDFKVTVLSCGATYVECRGVSLSTSWNWFKIEKPFCERDLSR